MNMKLIVLKLFLDALQIPADIETVDDRKRVQKAVYIGQLSGVDLGYRFGWYLMGPYSSTLTKDYYNLAESLALGDRDYEEQDLLQPVQDRIKQVLPLMDVPPDVPLSQEDWLELIASLHFLRKTRKYDEKKARATLNKEKPRLAPYFDKAEELLRQGNLL